MLIGPALLTAHSALAQPANNHFTNAWVLTGTAITTNGNSSQPSNANKEPGEPNHAGFVGGRSVWFQWIAPTNGPVRISTAGSGFNTLLAVYTGSAVNALAQVAANDNFPGQGNNTSRVDFNAQQGTEYRIAVDGRSGGGGGAASGAYVLALQMPGVASIITPTNNSLLLAGSPITIDVQASSPNPPITRGISTASARCLPRFPRNPSAPPSPTHPSAPMRSSPWLWMGLA